MIACNYPLAPSCPSFLQIDNSYLQSHPLDTFWYKWINFFSISSPCKSFSIRVPSCSATMVQGHRHVALSVIPCFSQVDNPPKMDKASRRTTRCGYTGPYCRESLGRHRFEISFANFVHQLSKRNREKQTGRASFE